MSKKTKSCKMTSIGGQALLEGIMMKGPHRTVMATRMPDKSIDIEDLHETHVRDRIKFLGWPIIRGSVNMVESLIYGYKALMKSAEKLGLDDDDEEVKDSFIYKIFGEKMMAVIGTVASILGVGLALVLFMWLPTVLFNFVNTLVTPGAALTFPIKAVEGGGNLSFYKGLFEGVIKIIIFLCYIALTALMKDIKRTYQYHGAEHKSIFCYEAGEELTVENVRKQSRFHPRCGTSFLVLILLISIILSSIVLMIFPALKNITWLWIIVKILMLPLIMGFGYEIIRMCGKHNNLLTRILSTPGMWVQRLTTKEPEDDMIEVAIAALTEVIPENPEDDVWGK